ncbi:type I restriction enzyme S subunit [Vibrio crassostreae]|uniref:restriction endonuclease subunit S n=1 Tax=Vibrio crassostreae TaxID=246167 RepID=UPI001199C7F6|nr:restriction endonuclease subunit S [Vibrio crassostreae]TWD38685.1 type I restriction enzyme S subunit [Vibrio crassostreae]
MTVNKPIGAKDLPEDWKWLHLEDLCSRVSVGHVGETNSHFCGEEGVPFLRSQNIRPGNVVLEDVKYVTNEFHQKSKKSQLLHGDIAIVRVGQNRGDCAVIPPNLPEVNCANIVFARLSDIRYSEFIGAFFNTSLGRESLLAVSTGSAQGVLNTKSIAKVVVPVPPVEKAYEIGNVYKSFSDKLELNSQTNQTLEQMAQAIFKSWFVDFDPVKAKMNGEQPEGMDAATASLFPEKLDSETGIPEGWSQGVIADIAKLNGKSWTKKKHPDEVYYVDLANTKNGVIESVTFYDFEDSPSRARRVLNPGDTIVGTVRPGNRSFAYIGETEQPLTGSTGFAVLTPKEEYWSSFVYLATTNDDSIDEYARLADGGAYPAIKPTVVAETECAIPSKEIAEKFWKLTGSMLKKAHQNRLENEDLAALRDTLLPKLLSGEIELDVAEVNLND